MRQAVLSSLAPRTLEKIPERSVTLVLGATLSLRLPRKIARLRRPGACATLPDCDFRKNKPAAVVTGVAALIILLTNKPRAAGGFPKPDSGALRGKPPRPGKFGRGRSFLEHFCAPGAR